MQTVLHFALSNALLAAVPALLAMAAWRWTKRPALAHALWVLALVKLVTPPVVGVEVPFPKKPAAVVAEPVAGDGDVGVDEALSHAGPLVHSFRSLIELLFRPKVNRCRVDKPVVLRLSHSKPLTAGAVEGVES